MLLNFNHTDSKLYGQELAEELSNKRVVDIQIPIQSTSDRIMKMMNRKIMLKKFRIT